MHVTVPTHLGSNTLTQMFKCSILGAITAHVQTVSVVKIFQISALFPLSLSHMHTVDSLSHLLALLFISLSYTLLPGKVGKNFPFVFFRPNPTRSTID